MNSIKKCNGPINNTKNKLNSKISRQKSFLPNTHISWVSNGFIQRSSYYNRNLSHSNDNK